MGCRKGIALLCAVLLMALLLSGCSGLSLDIESQLRPPKGSGEQEGIRQALNSYVQKNTVRGDSTDYVLTYPLGGSYRSPFILLDDIDPHTVMSDITGTTTGAAKKTALSEKALPLALAFYRMDTENSVTHVNLLEKQKDGWVSVSDAAGYSQDIGEVQFGDVNGDGRQELLVGWNQYSSNDKRLFLYSLNDSFREDTFVDTYTYLAVGDIMAQGKDNLLLVNASVLQAMASLYTYEKDSLVYVDMHLLDSRIQQFGSNHITRLADGVNGLFFDCTKDANTTITELIYWDGEALHTPFYNNDTGLTTQTARETAIACRDIDKDGQIEWPTCTRLPGYETVGADQALWLTTWHSFDYATGKAVKKSTSYVNLPDGYNLELESAWVKQLTAEYDSTKRLLTLQKKNGKQVKPFITIQTRPATDSAAIPADFSELYQTASLQYLVKFDKTASLTLEQIQYVFSVL